jgi:hypothetical protein
LFRGDDQCCPISILAGFGFDSWGGYWIPKLSNFGKNTRIGTSSKLKLEPKPELGIRL